MVKVSCSSWERMGRVVVGFRLGNLPASSPLFTLKMLTASCLSATISGCSMVHPRGTLTARSLHETSRTRPSFWRVQSKAGDGVLALCEYTLGPNHHWTLWDGPEKCTEEEFNAGLAGSTPNGGPYSQFKKILRDRGFSGGKTGWGSPSDPVSPCIVGNQ